MTVRDLVEFAAEHGGIVWHVESRGHRDLEFRFQEDEADTPALLNALEAAFGATWPTGRVAVFDFPEYPRQGHIRGTIDPGDGSAATLVVTMFAREPAVRPEPRRVEV